MSILNQPKILQDDVTNKLRNAINHRAICSRFDELEFHLGKTIAQGHRVCEVCFTRKRQQHRQ